MDAFAPIHDLLLLRRSTICFVYLFTRIRQNILEWNGMETEADGREGAETAAVG